MPPRKPDRYTFLRMFQPSQPIAGHGVMPAYYGGYQHSIAAGHDCWSRNNRLESALGPAPAGTAGAIIPTLMNVANTYGGMDVSGNIYPYFNQYIMAGSGTGWVGGSSIGSMSGSSLNEVPQSGGTPVPVGLPAPTSAAVIADTNAPGKNTGTYSILYTWIRPATGEESNRSPISNVVAVVGDGIKITGIGTAGTPLVAPDGLTTKIGIYCTHSGFGTVGTWFHLVDVDIATVNAGIAGTGYVIGLPNSTPGWYDGDLTTLAPIDYNQPPSCTFGFSLNDISVAAGCYGGNGLSPSIPSKIGAYPPEYVVFLPGGGTITACKGTGFEGHALIATANSLYLVSATYSSITPIDVQQIWPSVGFANGNCFCTVEDELYGFSGQRGAVRTRGYQEPETHFAKDVAEEFVRLGYTKDNTVLVYDPKTDCVLYCGGASGTNCLPYDRKQAGWQPNQTIAPIKSGVTSQGQGLLENSSTGALQVLEGGTGVAWSATTSPRDGELPGINKTYVRLRAIGKGSGITIDLITDPANLNSSALTISNVNLEPVSRWYPLNLPNVRDLAIKVSGDGVTGGTKQSFAEASVFFIEHAVSVGGS